MTKLPFTGKFKITCEYGRKGNLWAAGIHGGIDMVGITSTKVYSICSGTVVYAGWESAANHKKGFGKYVKIQSTTGEFVYLAHLDKVLVSVGTKVSPTTVVGIMGSTGNSTGPHTHVEIRRNGVKINAANYMGVPNIVGEYDSKNYQYNVPTKNETKNVIKTLARNTNLREQPHTLAKKTTYIAGTTVYVEESGVAKSDGYTWDKVKVRVTGQEGYMINKNYK